jgi:hypothetical protein
LSRGLARVGVDQPVLALGFPDLAPTKEIEPGLTVKLARMRLPQVRSEITGLVGLGQGPFVDPGVSYEAVETIAETAWIRQNTGLWEKSGNPWSTCNVGGGTCSSPALAGRWQGREITQDSWYAGAWAGDGRAGGPPAYQGGDDHDREPTPGGLGHFADRDQVLGRQRGP